jgi:hypothetical protein
MQQLSIDLPSVASNDSVSSVCIWELIYLQDSGARKRWMDAVEQLIDLSEKLHSCFSTLSEAEELTHSALALSSLTLS